MALPRWLLRLLGTTTVTQSETLTEAQRAHELAQRRLEAARRRWPEVNRARDRLGDAIERGLRGDTR